MDEYYYYYLRSDYTDATSRGDYNKDGLQYGNRLDCWATGLHLTS